MLPDVENWLAEDDAKVSALTQRERRDTLPELSKSVRNILDEVREQGDAALFRLTETLDGVALDNLRVTEAEFTAAKDELTQPQIQAIEQAIDNVSQFHKAQRPKDLRVETMPGVVCERIAHAIDAVGLYVPSGTAPLPSTVIMLAVPATIAGCPQKIICAPPSKEGRIDPSILVAAKLCGIDDVFKLGGAQAIAAMAYGSESVPQVNKIFGPGNAWVTEAKSQIAADPDGAAIDMPAGPSEVMIIADDSANPVFVAADLLSQAEHGADSQAILLTTSDTLANNVQTELAKQTAQLSRKDTILQALQRAKLIVVSSLDAAVDISNTYAPEHLILQTHCDRELLSKLRNAGSVFVGPWSPESVGDYASGTNHVLPTFGYARSYSSLGLGQFMRSMTVQELSREGLKTLAPTVTELAMLEGLDAHAAAVTCRINGCSSTIIGKAD